MDSERLLLAIDPGTTQSAYCYIDKLTYKPISFDKIDNRKLLDMMTKIYPADMAVEMMESYSMKVGQSTFETCVWIGRFIQAMDEAPTNIEYVYRHEERKNLLHRSTGGDTDIRHALIHRFAVHDKERGKGTKKQPDWFYGFKADCWMAYAVGVTYIDKHKEEWK